MHYTVYKPNPKKTGFLGSFRVSKQKNNDLWENKLFVEFVPQSGWDASKRLATWDAKNKKCIILNVSEAGELIHCIEHQVPWSSFHKSSESTTQIRFSVSEKNESVGQKGSANYWEGTKLNTCLSCTSNKNSFWITMNSGETRVLKTFLEHYIAQSLNLAGKNHSIKFSKND